MTQSSSTYGQILKNTGLLGGVQVVQVFLSIVRNKVAALLIGTFGMGLADLYSRMAEFVGSATNLGISFSSIRRLSALHDSADRQAIAAHIRVVRSWTLLTAIAGMLACILLSPLLSLWTLGDTHTQKGFILLSPMVALLTLTGGEMAILKALRQLKTIAAVNLIGALLAVLIAVPLYYAMGVHGILPVLLCSTGVMFLLNLHATHKLFPYRVSLFSLKTFRLGGDLVRLGSAYIIAGLAGSGAELIVRSYISQTATLQREGLFVAGIALIVSYSRLIFAALDADYFPRLSSVVDDRTIRNQTVNKQIDVLVLLMAPMLIVLALTAPLVVRILYSEAFLESVPMILCAMSYVYFKAVYSPIAYLPLAKGHSLTYLTMELIYDMVFVVLVTVGHARYGLVGAGIGLSLANLCDLLLISLVYGIRYQFRYDRRTVVRQTIQYALLLTTIALALMPVGWWRWPLGGSCLIVSLTYSWFLLKRKTGVIQRLNNLRQHFRKQ